MSNFRNAIQRKAHRERSTPAAQAKFGQVERSVDYKRRANDYKRKQTTIRKLQKAAAERNPDEFHHSMINVKRNKNGAVILKRDNTKSTADVKTIRTHDLSYLHSKNASETNQINKLQSSLQLLAGTTEIVDTQPVTSYTTTAAQAIAAKEITAPFNKYKQDQKKKELKAAERKAAKKRKPNAAAAADGTAAGGKATAAAATAAAPKSTLTIEADDEEDDDFKQLAAATLNKQSAAAKAKAAAAAAAAAGGDDNTRPLKRPRHTVFVDSEAELKSFNAAEYFETAPELAGRTFNRPRLETIAKAAPVPLLDPKVEATRVRQYRELAERLERKQKIEKIATKIQQQKNLLGPGTVRKTVTKDIFGAVIPDKTVYRWKTERKK